MAVSITWSDVTAMAPELSTVAVGTQNAILAAVALQLNEDDWGVKLNLAAVYLAAHLATISQRRGVGGPVVAEAVGQVSRSYASIASGGAQLGSTAYGLEYERLVLTVPAFRFAMAD